MNAARQHAQGDKKQYPASHKQVGQEFVEINALHSVMGHRLGRHPITIELGMIKLEEAICRRISERRVQCRLVDDCIALDTSNRGPARGGGWQG